MGEPEACPYVGRGGLKLQHALVTFGLEVRDLTCADFGCNVGGFTDCLLRHGAASVHAVDTGYGALAWTLRQDPRVTVMERSNALHATPPAGGVDLVVIDLGWTPQRLCLPAALRWLRQDGTIITLIKPHYELSDADRRALPRGGVLDDGRAEGVVADVVGALPAIGVRLRALTRSPVRGGKGRSTGNPEWLAWLEPV